MEEFRNLGMNTVLGAVVAPACYLDFCCFCHLFFFSGLTVCEMKALQQLPHIPYSSHLQIELVIANIDIGWTCVHGLM